MVRPESSSPEYVGRISTWRQPQASLSPEARAFPQSNQSRL